jgi:hypothetical protein
LNHLQDKQQRPLNKIQVRSCRSPGYQSVSASRHICSLLIEQSRSSQGQCKVLAQHNNRSKLCGSPQ